MFKRWIAAILVIALAGSIWFVASTTDDPDYADTAAEALPEGSTEDTPAEEAPAFTDDGSLIIRTNDGTTVTVGTGEVSVRGMYGYL